VKVISTRKDFIELRKKLGLRTSWHEPDEQGITVQIYGTVLDNAGFWGTVQVVENYFSEIHGRQSVKVEQFVVFYKNGKAVAEANLATLFAWVSQEGDDEKD